MGFFLRKSISLGKIIRINLSKSGIGLSAGVEGARVSFTPKGTRLYGGVGPIRYQKSISTVNKIKSSNDVSDQAESSTPENNRTPVSVGSLYTIIILLGLGLLIAVMLLLIR